MAEQLVELVLGAALGELTDHVGDAVWWRLHGRLLGDRDATRQCFASMASSRSYGFLHREGTRGVDRGACRPDAGQHLVVPDDEGEQRPERAAVVPAPLDVLGEEQLDRARVEQALAADAVWGEHVVRELPELPGEPARDRQVEPELALLEDRLGEPARHRTPEYVLRHVPRAAPV